MDVLLDEVTGRIYYGPNTALPTLPTPGSNGASEPDPERKSYIRFFVIGGVLVFVIIVIILCVCLLPPSNTTLIPSNTTLIPSNTTLIPSNTTLTPSNSTEDPLVTLDFDVVGGGVSSVSVSNGSSF
jgi:hypothetical protein